MRGFPVVITMDNRLEFAGRILDESFIGRLRDECLNTNWFMNIRHARDIIEDWRRDYNEVRPYSSLKGSTLKQRMDSNRWCY